jgi:predicted nuclease of predicted toxin-antitoxin system
LKILADENVPIKAVVALRSAGHDVRQVVRTPDAGSSDDIVWKIAQAEQRLVLTSDTDYRKRRNVHHYGLIIVRLRQPNSENIRRRTMDAIHEVSPDRWRGLTIVVRDRVHTLYYAPSTSLKD